MAFGHAADKGILLLVWPDAPVVVPIVFEAAQPLATRESPFSAFDVLLGYQPPLPRFACVLVHVKPWPNKVTGDNRR